MDSINKDGASVELGLGFTRSQYSVPLPRPSALNRNNPHIFRFSVCEFDNAAVNSLDSYCCFLTSWLCLLLVSVFMCQGFL